MVLVPIYLINSDSEFLQAYLYHLLNFCEDFPKILLV